MNKISFICLLFFTGLAYGQTVSGKSQTGSLKPVSPTIPPAENQGTSVNVKNQINAYSPFLTAEITFKDSSADNILGADESAQVLVSLRNIGGKPAESCEVELVPSVENSGIDVINPPTILHLAPNEEMSTRVLLRGSHAISTGNVEFVLKVLEKDGFDLDPEKILVVPTLAFQPPSVDLVDYGVQDPSRTGKIQKRENVSVTLRLQNRGGTTSHGTVASLTLGDNVISLDSSAVEESGIFHSTFNLGDLKPGDYKDVTTNLITNNRATDVRIDIVVTERSGEHSTDTTLELPFNIPTKKTEEIVVAARKAEDVNIPNVANLKLDIVDNLPVASQTKPDAFAVVIGNKDYTNAPGVEFALNDAAIMKRYLTTTMGFQAENIIYLENASQSDMTRVFGNESNYKGQLYDYVRKGSEIFVYYSGHGAPDTDSKEGYIVPVDCDPAHVALNGYSLKLLYSNLDKIDAEKELKHITVVLDACFSGSSVKGSLLANVSPIYIAVSKDAMASPNATIVTSASGDQVSGWYRDKQQSLFTYFFLKGLQGSADYEHNKTITAKELYEFTADEVNGVPYWSRRLNSKTQTPTFYGSDWVIYEGAK
ncbi:MAG TPA: caspase family protein [Candidatus Acidoferrales bacterium]|nr:caspase family protein [Candidatus Acidoferrales bacterium]